MQADQWCGSCAKTLGSLQTTPHPTAHGRGAFLGDYFYPVAAVSLHTVFDTMKDYWRHSPQKWACCRVDTSEENTNEPEDVDLKESQPESWGLCCIRRSF